MYWCGKEIETWFNLLFFLVLEFLSDFAEMESRVCFFIAFNEVYLPLKIWYCLPKTGDFFYSNRAAAIAFLLENRIPFCVDYNQLFVELDWIGIVDWSLIIVDLQKISLGALSEDNFFLGSAFQYNWRKPWGLSSLLCFVIHWVISNWWSPKTTIYHCINWVRIFRTSS